MKLSGRIVAVAALLGAAIALAIAGCAEQPEVTSETVEEVDEAAEEVYVEPGEEPGELVEPGVAVEEMTDETPPHVEEDGTQTQGPTEPGMESDELDPIETGSQGGGVEVDEMLTDEPPHTDDG